MQITYNEIGSGTGGGAGQIVPEQLVDVIPGETLSIIVGKGGAGGILNQNGQGANSEIISKIVTSDGKTLITTASNITGMGASGGSFDGTTVGIAGYVNNGLTSDKITIEGYSNTNGGAISNFKGGDGGKTILAGIETQCSPGAGGSTEGVNGGDAIGYGGCGGGGAGAGGIGGNGADGYVKITLIRE